MRKAFLLSGCGAAGMLLVALALPPRSRAQVSPSPGAAPPAARTASPQHDPTPAELHVEVPPPPFSDGIFPCTACHNESMPPNRTRRALSDMHTDIVLKHDTEHRWCLDCHDADHRDQLHLASGEPVPFEESYRLCGQCHGEKYRDWRVGVHGRRVGEWNGAKRYLLCVHCHSPHQPRFKSMAPQAAPRPPRRPQ